MVAVFPDKAQFITGVSESWASSSLFRTLVSHQFTVED